MAENVEAYRLAKEADHKAVIASMQISAHELVCTERYGNIKDQLSELKNSQKETSHAQSKTAEKIYLAIDAINKTISENTGKMSATDKIIQYVCIFIGAAGAVWGVFHT